MRCEHCGANYTIRYWLPPEKLAKRRYCSPACWGNARRGTRLREYTRKPIAERFWPKVDRRGDDECWEWKANRTPFGYGLLYIDTRAGGRVPRTEGAHRVSWELHNGPIPDGMWVLHRCDKPACVNPRHLFLGTCHDNVVDMDGKGRRRSRSWSGERNGNAKLSDRDVEEIRRLYDAGGITQTALAARFGVAQAHISALVRRKFR